MQQTVLGTGASGAVREALCRKTGQEVAVKMYTKRGMAPNASKNMRSELNIHGRMSHRGIVKLEGVYETEEHVYVVMEKLRGGEVFDWIYEAGRLSEAVVAKAALQILKVLAYMHGQNMVHRDIKMENLMFSDEGRHTLKLIDFGFATKFNPKTKLSQAVGTPQYVAPEVVKNEPYDEKVDMFSLGTVVYTMLTGTPLYGGSKNEIFKRKTHNKIYFSTFFRDSLSEGAQSFVKQLLAFDPADRPSAVAALSHPWLLSLVQDEVHDECDSVQDEEPLSDLAFASVEVLNQFSKFGVLLEHKCSAAL